MTIRSTVPEIVYPGVNATLCISIAERPGRFGHTVHNAAYRALGLDFLYVARKIDDIEAAMNAVRTLGIRGCSVSMPFKETVIPCLDQIDADAKYAGAVNTVLNENGRLTGYNTDIVGAAKALDDIDVKVGSSVVLLGAGGVARAILVALKMRDVKIKSICARSLQAAHKLADRFGGTPASFEEAANMRADVLINATSVGMAPGESDMPVPASSLGRFASVMDVVATPPLSRLVREAGEQNIPVVDGLTMTLHQACAQFEIYTNQPAPFDVMQAAARSVLAS